MPVESSSLMTFFGVSLSKYTIIARNELPCAAIMMFFPDSSSGTTCLHNTSHPPLKFRISRATEEDDVLKRWFQKLLHSPRSTWQHALHTSPGSLHWEEGCRNSGALFHLLGAELIRGLLLVQALAVHHTCTPQEHSWFSFSL
jgi:hypothetical protein